MPNCSDQLLDQIKANPTTENIQAWIESYVRFPDKGSEIQTTQELLYLYARDLQLLIESWDVDEPSTERAKQLFLEIFRLDLEP